MASCRLRGVGPEWFMRRSIISPSEDSDADIPKRIVNPLVVSSMRLRYAPYCSSSFGEMSYSVVGRMFSRARFRFETNMSVCSLRAENSYVSRCRMEGSCHDVAKKSSYQRRNWVLVIVAKASLTDPLLETLASCK